MRKQLILKGREVDIYLSFCKMVKNSSQSEPISKTTLAKLSNCEINLINYHANKRLKDA